MAIDEGCRYVLFTMMEALPPAGEDLATKADLAHELARLHQELGQVEVRSELKMEVLEHRLVAAFLREQLTAAITAQKRSMVFAMASMTTTVSGIAFAAARLTG